MRSRGVEREGGWGTGDRETGVGPTASLKCRRLGVENLPWHKT